MVIIGGRRPASAHDTDRYRFQAFLSNSAMSPLHFCPSCACFTDPCTPGGMIPVPAVTFARREAANKEMHLPSMMAWSVQRLNGRQARSGRPRGPRSRDAAQPSRRLQRCERMPRVCWSCRCGLATPATAPSCRWASSLRRRRSGVGWGRDMQRPCCRRKKECEKKIHYAKAPCQSQRNTPLGDQPWHSQRHAASTAVDSMPHHLCVQAVEAAARRAGGAWRAWTRTSCRTSACGSAFRRAAIPGALRCCGCGLLVGVGCPPRHRG